MKIQIGKEIYTIKKQKRITINGKGGFDGFADYNNRKILIKPSMNKKERDLTLYHELAHCLIAESYFLSKSKATKKVLVKLRRNEAFIEILGTLLLTTFKINQMKGGLK